MRIAFQNIAEKWDAKIIEINGESDHVHILLTYPPHKLLSGLIANLKSTSCKLMWDNYPDHLKKIYGQDKRVLWTGAYFVASCGGVKIDQLKKYVENQDSPKYYLCFAVLYWSVFHLRGETESLQTDISGKNSSITALITQTIKLNFLVGDGKNLINLAKKKSQGRKGVKWFRIAGAMETDKQGNGSDF